MNELKQIRAMAEIILEKVAALEGASPEGIPEPKFRVGDTVRWVHNQHDQVLTIAEVFTEDVVEQPSGAKTNRSFYIYKCSVNDGTTITLGESVLVSARVNSGVE